MVNCKKVREKSGNLEVDDKWQPWFKCSLFTLFVFQSSNYIGRNFLSTFADVNFVIFFFFFAL